MSKIIDYVECDACSGEGEIKNAAFQNLPPEERLRLFNAAQSAGQAFNVDTTPMDPTFKCPFCTDGQAPIYECDECDGTGNNGENPERPGCPKCENTGWYL